MLVGRVPEQQRLARLVAGARIGESGVLVLRGEAGIGKTALLDDTAARAEGMRVLRIAGTAPESGLSFAGLHRLLLPALGLLDRIPGPQRDALSIALTLATGPSPDRFAVGAAAVSLLSRFAEERPLLVLLDDAHRLDPPSAQTVLFVARRLMADPIALVATVRPPGSPWTDADLPVLDLDGLDLPAATELLGSLGPHHPDLVARLHRATAGNPLALVELGRDTERIEMLGPEAPIPVPEAVSAAYADRVAELSPPTRAALLVAVVANADQTVTAHAATAVGATVGDLVAAEAVGLLRLDHGRIEFRHPLVRSAVYAAATPAHRRRAHRAVADALPDAALDLQAWHRSAAALGPDDTVADALVAAAGRARARGADGVATVALARAADLTDNPRTRARRLLAAGESAWSAGQGARADALLRQVPDLCADADLLTDADGLRGTIALRSGSLDDARRLLQRAAASAPDPDRAVVAFADMVAAFFYLCDPTAGLAAADRLEALLPRCSHPPTRIRAQVAIGIARVLAGRPGVAWIRTAVTELGEDTERHDDPRLPDWAVIGTLFLRESRAGRDLVARAVTDLRARTALSALPNLLFLTARDDATTDRWRSALTGFGEGIALAREAGQSTDLAVCLAGLAWLEARMGRADDSRAHAGEARDLARRYGIVIAALWADFADGDRCLAAGDAAGAICHYVRLSDELVRVGFDDVDLAPGPDLTEAYVRIGQADAAGAAAADYLARAERKGQPWALARAHRAAALVAADGRERVAAYERALSYHADNPDRFEEARTRLAFGAALRRDKTRVAARPHLRAALEIFDALGARPWSEAAARELDATGERAHRPGAGYLDVLTAQEIQIARLLASGRTTKEAAATLFLSPKTVEYHLRHVYQKLGINSRTDLAAALSADPEVGIASPPRR
ncbi:MAG TPA: LuxR C-terminal-related transcriptional regulator [Aldersonia sp.]